MRLDGELEGNYMDGSLNNIDLDHSPSNYFPDNPVEVLNEHLSLLVGRYVPTKIIRVRNKDKPWFDDLCRRAFDLKQEAHLRWTRDNSG